MNKELWDKISAAKREITHGTDGPVTDFVVLMRAMEAVAKGGDPTVYGNAYYEWKEGIDV